jgi:hypothetical protein
LIHLCAEETIEESATKTCKGSVVEVITQGETMKMTDCHQFGTQDKMLFSPYTNSLAEAVAMNIYGASFLYTKGDEECEFSELTPK